MTQSHPWTTGKHWVLQGEDHFLLPAKYLHVPRHQAALHQLQANQEAVPAQWTVSAQLKPHGGAVQVAPKHLLRESENLLMSLQGWPVADLFWIDKVIGVSLYVLILSTMAQINTMIPRYKSVF